MSSLELNPEQEPIIICIAGHCSGNPGPGSWSAVLLWQGKSKRISGEASSTTNNQMIITAAVEAFKLLKKPCKVKLYTNSEYLTLHTTKVVGFLLQPLLRFGKPTRLT